MGKLVIIGADKYLLQIVRENSLRSKRHGLVLKHSKDKIQEGKSSPELKVAAAVVEAGKASKLTAKATIAEIDKSEKVEDMIAFKDDNRAAVKKAYIEKLKALMENDELN